MPFRNAHWGLFGLLGIAGMAFWPNYFGQLSSASLAFHVHAITAFVWMLMLVGQGLLVRNRSLALHRTLGLGIFGVFPLLLGGALLILHSMAGKFVAAADPMFVMYGARLAVWDAVAALALAGFVAQAIRSRRQLAVHGGYMLATALFLAGPALARVLTVLPPLALNGPADLYRFGYAVHLADALTAAIALYLAARIPAARRPFVIAALVIVVQSVLFDTLGRTAGWEAVVIAFAKLPALGLFIGGALAGLALLYSAWRAVPTRRSDGPALAAV